MGFPVGEDHLTMSKRFASRQFQQQLLAHSVVGKEQDIESIPSNLGDPHPKYVGDNTVTPWMTGAANSFDRQAGAWLVHKSADKLPMSLQGRNFGTLLFKEPTEFDIPKSHTGKPRQPEGE